MTKPEDATRPPAVGTPLGGRVVSLFPKREDPTERTEFEAWARNWHPATAIPGALDRCARSGVYINCDIASARLGWLGAFSRYDVKVTG